MKAKRNLEIKNYKILGKPVEDFSYASSKLFLACSDSFWHNGIHLTLNGDAIKNIYEGTIIACRFSSGFKTKDIDFDKFKINPEMLESFNVSAGNFFIYNYFELKDGNYQLKEEFKSENDENKIIQELIKKELGRGYSNSFVLIEHTAEKSIIEKNSSNPSKIKYQFYTLFNHLRPLNYYTNKEKSDLFLYSAELEFTRTVPYNYVKGYYVLDNLRQKRQEIIKIPSETKVSEIDYYEYTLNKETKYAYIDESMVRKFTSHSETRRPAFTNSEKKDPEYLKPGNYRTVPNEMFLFDNIKKSKRCVKGIITKKDNIEINYEAFITYLKNSSEDIGLEISSLNGFIYFSKSIKDTLKACLVEYNSWDIKSNPKPNITYNIKNGFLLTGRHTPSGQKEYYYLSQNKNIYIPDVECHYIQAKKLKSNSEYAVEDIYIPCELKIKETESSSTAFKKVEYYLNGSRQKCYISYDSFRKFTSHLETKRKLRPYESAEANSSSAYLPRTSHDVIDEILIFDTNDISKRLVKASVPKTTKFQISKPELEKLIKNLSDESSDNKKNKFEEGIFVNYDTGSSKGSGYIYLPWGYDLPNIDDNQVAKNLETVKNNVKSISEKLDEWLTKLHQKEEISFKEFKLKLKKDERISEDQIYSYNGTGESIKLEKGDVLGFGGYAAESPVENEDLYKIPDYIHFETFCVNTDFMSFNKNRIDYTADFKIKNEVSVHKQNPTTKTIIKHLPALQFSYNLRKSFFQNMFIKPSFITSPELMNESLQLMYFKKGKKVSLIESETFVELEICGSLKELADNEYIHRDQFDAAYSKPIYTLNNTQELSIYIDEGKSVKESDNKITLYKNYRYEYNGEKLNCALLSTHNFKQFKVYHAACSARSTIWND